MSDISVPKRLAMASAVRNLANVAQTHISMYKTDRFLADADWDIVAKNIFIEDPYKTTEEEADLDALTHFERYSRCPNCDTKVLNEPSAKELAEMAHARDLPILVDAISGMGGYDRLGHVAIPFSASHELVDHFRQFAGPGRIKSSRYCCLSYCDHDHPSI